MPFVTVNGKRFFIQSSEVRKDFARNQFIVSNGKRIFIEPVGPDFKTSVARRMFDEDKPTTSQIRAARVQLHKGRGRFQ